MAEHGKVLDEFFLSTAGSIGSFYFITIILQIEILILCSTPELAVHVLSFLLLRKISDRNREELGSWDYFKKKLKVGQQS